MKTIVTPVTTVMLVAGATGAMASDLRGSNEVPGHQLSLHQAVPSFGGAYASARIPGEVRNSTFNVPASRDFQLNGR